MNILHHKSWHVRNKNNIAKVRAAEKAAREEEEAKEKRKLIAESEARVNLLRSKARLGKSTREDDATVSSIVAILDGKEPSSVGEDRQNEDYVKEVKKDKEDWEKKVGILTYLGQGCNEDNPWYLLDHNSRMKLNEDESTVSESSDKPKSYLKSDPMIEIERNLAIMKKNKQRENSSIPPIKVHASPPVMVKKESERSIKRTNKDKKCKKSKHKKHKNRHKSKKSRSSTQSESDTFSSDESSSSDDDDGKIQKQAKLEALRAERLRREKAERERSNQLLNKTIKSEPKVELDDRKRGYNSQFNPHLARQNLEKLN